MWLIRSIRVSCVAVAGLASALAGSACAGPVDDGTKDVNASDEEIRSASGADAPPSALTPGLQWLSARSETELTRVFSSATATRVPIGPNRGLPILRGVSSPLQGLAAKIYQGTTWIAETKDGAPVLRPDGDPKVTVRDAFIPGLSFLGPFKGHAIRTPVSALRLSTGLAPRPGVRRPDPLSSYSQAFSTDEKTSIWVDYSDDPTPLVNRIVDEIREVDGARCRGLFIGRAHFLQDEGKNEWSYLFYFGLDFGGRDGACDLSAAPDRL